MAAGLARTCRPWDRMDAAFAGSRSSDAGDSPERSERGFWPKILRLTRELVDSGYEPSTAGGVARGSASVEVAIFDAVMERRAHRLMEQVRAWLPAEGPVLDLGSGTGHLSARLERDLGLEVVAADVSDIHVVGPPPVLIADGVLRSRGTHTAALLVFMLAYPKHPASVLTEVARVTRGPIIVVQSLHANRFGYAWLRVREFLWTSWHSTCRSSLATSLRRRSSP